MAQYGQSATNITLKNMKFIADVMVGKLARYLRMAGYDVLYINDASDDEIIKIAQKSGRIVLTRDSLMLKRRIFKNGTLRSVFIKHDLLIDQLRQLHSGLGLSLNPDLARCLVCNDSLIEATRAKAKDKVPPYVFKTQEDFMYCSKCGHYYWKGTHYDNIKKIFTSIGSKLQ